MKEFLKRLKIYHWIAILFAIVVVVLGVRDVLYPIPDEWALWKQMTAAADSSRLSKDSYSYICVDHYDNRFLFFNEKRVMLEIGVIDEAAVDEFLASWEGEGWDKLVKLPGNCSVATQEEFVRRAKEEIYLGPGVQLAAYVGVAGGNSPGSHAQPERFLGPRISASVRLSPSAKAADWQEMPQQLKDLAEEMGVPEEIIVWDAPTIREGPSEDDLSP